jgi:hypothetical protein
MNKTTKTTEHTFTINNGIVNAELTRMGEGNDCASDFWLFPHGTATASDVAAMCVRENEVSIHWGPNIYRYDYAGQASAMSVVAHFFTTMSLGRTANFIKREATLRTKNGERVAA